MDVLYILCWFEDNNRRNVEALIYILHSFPGSIGKIINDGSFNAGWYVNMRINQKPDFIIAGAPRSGTTWLYHLLDRHPQIFMNKPIKPEPKFFLIDEIYETGLEHYLKKYFPNAPKEKMWGEKSTNYLENSVAATRIYENLPGIKLIFILRHPVDRAFSNYLWSRMNGLEQEDFATAIEQEDVRLRNLPKDWKYSRPYDYFARGLYVKHLRPYFDLFSQDQILVLKFEDISIDPEKLTARIHQFLGVQVQPLDWQGLGIINPSRKDDIELPAELREKLNERYSESNRELGELLGADFEVWNAKQQ